EARLLAVVPSGMRTDRAHHLVENPAAKLVSRAILAQKLVQLMLTEIVIRQLEQPLVRLEAEPDDRAANEVRRPVDRANHPRHTDRRQIAGRRLIDDERGVVVLLQEARRDDFGNLVLDRLANDRRLMLAERHDDDLARLHDRADAHRQGLVGYVLLAEEIA